MDFLTSPHAILMFTALVAAVVNGALGYGFSSITVPVALGFFSNKVLNPALVLVEVALNTTSLALHWRVIPKVWRRTLPLMAGLLPGILAGSFLLGVAAATPLKAVTYALLLPLILLQAANIRLPLRDNARATAAFGAGLGTLYSTTTISGPPLALFLNNQGLAQDEFRTAISLVRVAESSITLITYLSLGYITDEPLQLALTILPSVVVGLPLGRMLFSRVSKERFRQVAMGVDALLVSIGLAVALGQLGWVPPSLSLPVIAAASAVVLATLWRRARSQKSLANVVQG